MSRRFNLCLLVLVLILAACSPAAGKPNPRSAAPTIAAATPYPPTIAPSATALPTATNTPLPTTTSTPTPTVTPIPTATPISRPAISIDNLGDIQVIDKIGGIGGLDIACALDESVCALMSDAGLILFDPTTAEKKFTIGVEGGKALLVSPDNQRILVLQDKGKATSIEVNTGTLLEKSIPFEKAAGFCPDGQHLFSYGWGVATARLFCIDSQTEKLFARLELGPAIAIDPEAKQVASAMHDDVYLYDLETGKEVTHLVPEEIEQVQVSVVVFSPDHRLVAWGGDGGILRVWDIQARKEVYRESAGMPLIHGLRFSPQGTRLYLAGMGQAKQITTTDWKETSLFPVFSPGVVKYTAFMPSGNQLFFEEEQNSYTLLDLSGASAVTTSKGIIQPLEDDNYRDWPGAVLDPNGKWAAAIEKEKVILVDLITNQVRWTAAPEGKPMRLAVNPAGTILAVGSKIITDPGGEKKDPLTLWDTQTGQIIRSMSDVIELYKGKNITQTDSLAFSHDGRYLATSGLGPSFVKIRDVETGEEIKKIPCPSYGAFRIVFSPDDQWLAMYGGAYNGEEIRLVNVESGQMKWSIPARIVQKGSGSSDLVFSQDGKLLIALGRYHLTMQFFDVSSGRVLRKFELTDRCGDYNQQKCPLYGPETIALSPDGRLLAAGGDGNLYLLGIQP